MSNGTFDLKSDKVTELYRAITEQQPAQEHWTLDGGGFAAVIKKRGKTSILIYHFARSIKPLARIVEGGAFAVMRDYYTEEQLMSQLEKLHAAVTSANVTAEFSGGSHTHGGPSFKVGPDDHLYPADEGVIAKGRITSYPNGISAIQNTVNQSILANLSRNPKVCDPHRQ